MCVRVNVCECVSRKAGKENMEIEEQILRGWQEEANKIHVTEK